MHAKGKPFAPDVDLEGLAKRTVGMSGADLANVINEAALLTAREHGTLITGAALEESVDRVIGGPRRKSKIISEQEKKITAYHEGGHALAAWAMPDLEPVYKLTILPRGRTGGHALVVPEDDKGLMTRSEMIARLVFAMGGRSAEELVFHEPTTGASSDIDQATKISKAMVTEYGMSARLGAVRYGREQGDPFLGRSMGNQPDYSLEVAHEIDEEVRALIEAAHTEAWEILNTYRDVLDDLVFELLEKETLTRTDLERILTGGEAAADHRVQRFRRADAVGQAADPVPGRAGRNGASRGRRSPARGPPRRVPTRAANGIRSRARAVAQPRRSRRAGVIPAAAVPAARLPDRVRAGRWAAAGRSARRRAPGDRPQRDPPPSGSATARPQPSSVPHNHGAPPDWPRPPRRPASPGRPRTRHLGAGPAPRLPPTPPAWPAPTGAGQGPSAGNGNGEHTDSAGPREDRGGSPSEDGPR